MRHRGLLSHANLDGIEMPKLTEEERETAAYEHSIQVILDRVENEPALRTRLRKQAKTLKADIPGRKPSISDKDTYEFISSIMKLGKSMEEAISTMANLIPIRKSSIRTKYMRGKSNQIASE